MTAEADVRIVIADDHPIVRAGLRAVLQTEPGFVVVAECSTAEQAVQRCAQGDADVVLMDLQFGAGMGGAAATAAITQTTGGPRVVILTTYDSDADVMAAIDAGASGYLLKDAPPEELAIAVRTAAAGGSALAPTIATRLLERLRAPGVGLSPRELEVLQLVAEGLSNQQISQRLFLSQATIKTHLAHVYAKLDVDSRSAAVATATKRGILRR
ncbi:response regulator [Actinotalea solisilvae]|uniref:response regulator n=1 Tax=Actinotalea solisilvae TaxID=2072922 RepID=UPI0018F13065|nr:response regulator transcription factor [Actinotalea solisilvae]